MPATEEAARALAEGLVSLGLDVLPLSKALAQWRERVMFLRKAEGEEWPDLSDEALAATAEEWLAPHLVGRAASARSARISSAKPYAAFCRGTFSGVSTRRRRPMSRCRPARRSRRLWSAEGPVLAVRVQELFGLDKHPTIAGGRVPLILHLLSPAQRPIQITRDLPGFWRGSWAAGAGRHARAISQASLAGRPAAAPPTRRAKPRRRDCEAYRGSCC